MAGTVATATRSGSGSTAVGEETALAGIQRLVEEAQAAGRGPRLWPTGRRAAVLRGVGAGVITFVVWLVLG